MTCFEEDHIDAGAVLPNRAGEIAAGTLVLSDVPSEEQDSAAWDSDVMARIMAVAAPKEAASLAQSCSHLRQRHQELTASLPLSVLQDRSSRHILGVSPDTAYISLQVPDELIDMAQLCMTTFQVQAVALALRPNISRTHAFVQRAFQDTTSQMLLITLLVPGGFDMVAKRQHLAPVLCELVEVVKRDVKTALSSYALALQCTCSLDVYYDLRVSIQTSCRQHLHDLYFKIRQHLGPVVLDQLLDREVEQYALTGHEFEYIQWKETGLAAMFGQKPSARQEQQTGHLSPVVSGSAQLWRFTPTHSQILPAHCFDDFD